MLLDTYSGKDLRQDEDSGDSADESRRFTIFNDLTYSDDEEGVEWRETDHSFGVDSHTSSPDTAALLNEIQKAMLPTQKTHCGDDYDDDDEAKMDQHEQLHLIHPLAHYDSFRNSEGDEGSQLAYSITSSVMSPPITNYGSLEPVAPYFDYNNNYNNAAKSTAVNFRSPPNVFHSPRSNDSPPPIFTSASSLPMPPYLKPKLPHRVEKVAAPTVPSTTIHRRQQSKYDKVKGNRNIHKLHHPITPLPSITNVSPATSATATDTTESPNDVVITTPHPPPRPLPPGERRLSHDDTKRQRKHRRLRRIKKAAEAREAMVQKVRGVEQHTTSSSSSKDSIFAYAFLCQFLLVSISALAFGSAAIWDIMHDSLSTDHASGVGYDGGGGGSSTTTIVDRNPFAGLETDDVIIADGVTGAVGRKVGGGLGGKEEKINMTDGISDIDFINVLQLVCITSGYACLCSLLSLGFMMMLSKNTLYVMLMFTIAVCLSWTIMGFAFSPYWITPLAGALASTLSIVYTLVVWDRISFAATNLSVALKGMRSTFYIPCVGFFILAITFIWTVWWTFALIGTLNYLSDDEDISDDLIYVVVAFFAFSYYWTFQVIKGVSQSIIASIVGKWWLVSEDEQLSMYSADLRSMIKNRIMKSIGSICLGSLIVDPCVSLSRITTFSHLVRPKLDCVNKSEIDRFENTSSLPQYESVISRTVNQWSFTYIGLYGYDFWDSGSKASELFKARGWTHIISDDLVMTVMGMSSMIIGGSTALLGLIVEEVDGYYFTSGIQKPIATTFLICLFVGYFLSNAFLSIVEGCISAILVCYAASPVEFHANHHKLCEEMKSVWKLFWLQKPQ